MLKYIFDLIYLVGVVLFGLVVYHILPDNKLFYCIIILIQVIGLVGGIYLGDYKKKFKVVLICVLIPCFIFMAYKLLIMII